MKIAIGTKSPPKLEAIKQGIKDCVYLDEKNVELISLKVSSDVSDMPTSLEENMQGAKNRALNSKKETKADFYVGMEGGMNKIGEKAYLFGVVYILNNVGEGHFGFSNMMEVPELFSNRVFENGEELGYILGEVTGDIGASKKNGAFGYWSDNMMTRKSQFILAFLSAISPFYNKFYK